MEADLRNLIDDPGFQAYHRDLVQPGEFNTFDVLRYADYEIRHSNVLAWLLRPADTHGIGSQLLKWFVTHVNGRLAAADVERLPETSFEAANVDVCRELDYVDITIRFKKERCLIAIENKTESASSDHLDQVVGYERKLRRRHENHTVRSVLLTTSPDGKVNFPGIAHVGWDSVHEAIDSVLRAGEFPSPSVQAFIRQYLELVERWFRPAGGEGFKSLLDDHRSILKEMRRALEKDGDDGVRRMVSADRTEYCDSLAKLVRESRLDPKQLRVRTAEFLKDRGCTPTPSDNGQQTVYWLGWTDATLRDAALRMGGHRGSLSWSMAFTHRNVRVSFVFYSKSGRERSFVDRLKGFMEKTPINRQKIDEYSVKDAGYGYERVYREEILSNEELVEMSVPEVEDAVIRRLRDFMDSDDSEYRRVDDYFQCLAFRSNELASTQEDSP